MKTTREAGAPAKCSLEESFAPVRGSRSCVAFGFFFFQEIEEVEKRKKEKKKWASESSNAPKQNSRTSKSGSWNSPTATS